MYHGNHTDALRNQNIVHYEISHTWVTFAKIYIFKVYFLGLSKFF